jgi:peptidoglycan lytic transglycosylase
MPSDEGSDAMPLRGAIGISLACLVTSACATGQIPETAETAEAGKTAEEGAPHDPGEAAAIPQQGAETPNDKSRSFPCASGQEHRSADYGSERAALRFARFDFAVDACDRIADRCCGPARTIGKSQFGKAVWYDHVGRPTASGEVLDTVTPTAAHRSLPLASFAKVTNLDNGRSIVVKINDRGPFTRGRILDLSPRAADVLDMKEAGVVAVVIEPLVNRAPPTGAVF